MKAAKRGFLSLLFLFLAASPILLTQTVSAQVPPSAPEFAVQTQNQANVTTITLTIQNQPYNAANYPGDDLFYNVRIRTSEENWSELYTAEDWYPQQSNESTTVITYVTGQTAYLQQQTSQGHPAIPMSGTVEFEVQAMIGHRDRGNLQPGTMIMPYVFVGVTSEWSPAQAVNLDAHVATSTSTIIQTAIPPPSGKPDALGWIILVFLVAIVVGLLTAAIVLGRRSGIRKYANTELRVSSLLQRGIGSAE